MTGCTANHVVAIETRWFPELLRARLYVYRMSAETFTQVDAGAGYYVTREPVEPLEVELVEDLAGALLGKDVELRVMPSLWKLRDLVIESSLQFSIIRFRNSAPPPADYVPKHV
jgi:hypothetical protein